MPYNAWAGSMMANAARDPLFWAALDVANADVPGAGDTCLRCHAPQAWLRGRVSRDASGTAVNGADGCLLQGDHDDVEGNGNDFDGVGCHYCHRVMDRSPASLQLLDIGNADIWIDDAESCQGSLGPCRRGPYSYPDAGGNLAPQHGWSYSPLHADSALCGYCHQAVSPPGIDRHLILADGSDSGRPFPLDQTYAERRASDDGDLLFTDGVAFNEPLPGGRKHGVSCQECHVPLAGGIENAMARACIDNLRGGRKDHLPVHEFVGGNAWMPQVLNGQYGTALNRSAEYQRTAQLAVDNLQLHSATLDLRLGSVAADRLPVQVRVTNLSGHKLPTGFVEARRMWLELTAYDADGKAFWHSGVWDATTRTCVERDAQGRPQFHTLLANCVVRDTRIPPAGFSIGDDPLLQPIGRNYAALPGGHLANYDDVDYAVALPAGVKWPVSVQARLRYQVLTRDYADFLRDAAIANATPSENAMCLDRRAALATGPRDRTRAEFLHQLWQDNARAAPVTLQSATATAQ